LLEHKRVASKCNATQDWQRLVLQQNFTVEYAVNFHSWLSTKNNSVQQSFEAATETISDLENVGRQRRRRSAGTSRHFRRSYLRTN